MQKKIISNLLTWTISGVLLLAALCVAVFATPLFGNRVLIVRSGSMEPTISVSDLVVVRPSNVYRVGDAISFREAGRPKMIVTHRIVEVQSTNSTESYVTKGDANEVADEVAVTRDQVIGREIAVVPWVGKVLAFGKTKLGFGAFVVIPILLIVMSELRVIWREVRRSRQTKLKVFQPVAVSEPRLVPSVSPELLPFLSFLSPQVPARGPYIDGLLKKSLVAAVSLAVLIPSTHALFSDAGVSTSNIFTAAGDFGGEALLPVPANVIINEVMWMGSLSSATSGADDEWIELRNLSSTSVTLVGWSIVGAGSGASSLVLMGTIPGNGYFLISNFAPNDPLSALKDDLVLDQSPAPSISFVNTGEQLTLKNADGTTIDQTPIPPPAWAAGEDENTGRKSMERDDPPGIGTDVSNWHTCLDAACNDGIFWDAVDGNNYGTPRAANSSASP